ncbi:MAG: hypothetical protein ACERKD_20525 [Prolixibacteraceae bacterium]
MKNNNVITHSTLNQGYDFFITDKWKKKYHFKILTFNVPSGVFSEAIEVIKYKRESANEPRIFHVLADFDADIENTELLLKAKIKKGINKRYLNYKNGIPSICDDMKITGRILSGDQPMDSQFDYYFAIDGKKISIENFLEMLDCVVGYNFKFQILDTCEDIDDD